MKRIFLLLLCLGGPLFAQELPLLNWEPRSDWLNVKHAPFNAVGDGVADDTLALQSAVDQLSERPGETNTLYLPPGSYRITKTIHLKQRDGISMFGHGRSTVIQWDGPAGTNDDSRMFWSDGAPRSRYIGITWDGKGRAFVGFDHDSKGYFETESDHQHEAFFNFTGAGIRVGHRQVQASAETVYQNCLFMNCENGLLLMEFNDYDHTLVGCEFRGCGRGVNGTKGENFYVRDSHFEKTRVADIATHAEHGVSVRRTTSVGSRMFFESSMIAPVTLEDCQVSGWTNAAAAVMTRGGPVLIFDCAFSKPPSHSPPIELADGQHGVFSNNKSPDTDSIVRPDRMQNVTEVPAGKRNGVSMAVDQHFFTSNARIPGKIFDARRDFGARGDGKTDDSAAIQSAIDAARAHGSNSMAYLPSGEYRVTRTLEISGRDWFFGGGGIRSRIFWGGSEGGVVLRVNDPDNVTVENIDLTGNGKNAVDILNTSSGVASLVRYERVWVFGMYAKQPATRGMRFEKLGEKCVVIADHLTGNLRVSDCQRARLLFGTTYEGAITITGKDPVRDGVAGFMTRLATINTRGLFIEDSQDIVMSDYYVESADALMRFSGQSNDPSGRITIQMVKSHCLTNPVIQIDNYHGRVALGPAMFYPGGVSPALISQQGQNACVFVLMAAQAYEVAPKFEFGTTGTTVLLGNTGRGMGANEISPEGLMFASDALDDLRELGALDFELNFPEISERSR